MSTRKFALLGGTSYLIIFFAAVFANFFVLERILASPLEMVQENGMMVRFGIMAFLLTVVFDVVVAWALYELYKSHVLTLPSTLFRMMHAALMGIAIFSLPLVFQKNTEVEILYLVDIFNNIWPIGLFFFGVHLIFLGIIIGKPKIIGFLLIAAGLMYMVDTSARFLMPNYQDHADIFLLLVAIPSIIGELSFAIWLLIRGGKTP